MNINYLILDLKAQLLECGIDVKLTTTLNEAGEIISFTFEIVGYID